VAQARLVVFDLDGTITYHDTLVPYVIGYLRQKPWRLLRLVQVLPAVIAFVLRLADHGKVKAALLRATLRGRTRAELQAWTDRFVPQLIAHGMRAQALEAIAEHRRRGDHLVLLSASPDLYVPTIAQHLGFAESICTGVSWDRDRLVGELTTANRRGDEKTRVFRALRERFPGLATMAYANGPSDIDHLYLSDDRLLVNAPVWVRRKAALLGIACDHWR
jgi:phosphatidylglycerophosphatase C